MCTFKKVNHSFLLNILKKMNKRITIKSQQTVEINRSLKEKLKEVLFAIVVIDNALQCYLPQGLSCFFFPAIHVSKLAYMLPWVSPWSCALLGGHPSFAAPSRFLYSPCHDYSKEKKIIQLFLVKYNTTAFLIFEPSYSPSPYNQATKTLIPTDCSNPLKNCCN